VHEKRSLANPVGWLIDRSPWMQRAFITTRRLTLPLAFVCVVLAGVLAVAGIRVWTVLLPAAACCGGAALIGADLERRRSDKT
jgi:ABC-type cobalamin transport system permease subunit